MKKIDGITLTEYLEKVNKNASKVELEILKQLID